MTALSEQISNLAATIAAAKIATQPGWTRDEIAEYSVKMAMKIVELSHKAK